MRQRSRSLAQQRRSGWQVQGEDASAGQEFLYPVIEALPSTSPSVSESPCDAARVSG